MPLLPTDPLGDDKPGCFENSQVLHHPEPGQLRMPLCELPEGLPIELEERVEQIAPGGVGEGLEDLVIPGRTHHAGDIR